MSRGAVPAIECVRQGALRFYARRPYTVAGLEALRGRSWQRLLKDDVTTRVAVEEMDGPDGKITVVIKRYNPKGAFWAFRYSVRRSGGLRSWRGANELVARGIPTAEPIAAWEWRVGPFLRESAFVMAYLGDCEELHFFVDRTLNALDEAERRTARRKTAKLIGTTLATMHDGGLFHRDLKASNWMVRAQGGDVKDVLLLDLDGPAVQPAGFPAASDQGPGATPALAGGTVRLDTPATEPGRCDIIWPLRGSICIGFATGGSGYPRYKVDVWYPRKSRDTAACRFQSILKRVHLHRDGRPPDGGKGISRSEGYRMTPDHIHQEQLLHIWRQGFRRARHPIHSLREIRKILIVKPSSLGDVVHGLPVLNVLRENFPKAQISWLVKREFAAVLTAAEGLDQVIVWDRGTLENPPRELGQPQGVRQMPEGRGTDRVRPGDRSAGPCSAAGLMAFATGAPVRVGFSSARELFAQVL